MKAKRLLLILSIALLGAGCFAPPAPAPAPQPAPAPAPAPAPTPAPVDHPGTGGVATLVQYGEAFDLKIGEFRSVQGGLQVTLEEMGDSRCKPDVQCIWAGELSPKLLFELPGTQIPSKEVTMGTTTKQTTDVLGFHVVLKDATASQATLVITK